MEKLFAEVELEGANGMATPGLKVNSRQAKDENKLPESEFTRFRALSARASYLAADRPDVIFAAKEMCRFMSAPTDLAWNALTRLCCYLRSRPVLCSSTATRPSTH